MLNPELSLKKVGWSEMIEENANVDAIIISNFAKLFGCMPQAMDKTL